jgi:hypothetical protein
LAHAGLIEPVETGPERCQPTGFRGIGGFIVAKLVLGTVRRKMLSDGLPAVLNDLEHSSYCG